MSSERLVEEAITGATRVVGVIGWPVAHSLSPPMHNAAFGHLGMDWVYVAFPVAPEYVPEAVGGVRGLGVAGINVTIPHKQAVVEHLDELDQTAADLEAVNTIHNADGRLKGYNTDGPGLVRSLEEAGFSVAGKRIAVIGAGGSARAVVFALARAGASYIAILNRTVERAVALADMVREKCGYGSAEPLPLVGPSSQRAVESADAVVDCTSVGMHPNVDVAPVVPPEWLHAGQVVCDLTYNPRETVLLKAAKRRGAVAVDGTGMLVHQGAIAFEIWTGREAPVEIMRAALLRALDKRSHNSGPQAAKE
ncbi:MAG: shikimate dehydrogenase [Armatimonadetes bacterium]|nr:shikimate dehydrogenase [Armatimonadota bacterium]